jgi:UDP-glucose 4-epimerase
MRKKILILGAAGFIGSNLSLFFLKKKYQVYGIDNFHLGRKSTIISIKNKYKKNFFFKKIDISNKLEIKKIPKKNYNFIINLIANSDISKSEKNSFIDLNLNLKTLVNVLDFFKKYKKTIFFFASTSAIYGNHSKNVNENTDKLEPISHYGASKLACEKYIRSFYEYHKLKHVIFRFPNVIGPYLTHGVIFDFLQKLKKSNYKVLNVLGDGTQSKNYIYVDDLCKAIYLALKKHNQNINIYNISTSKLTSVRKIVYLIKKIYNIKFKTNYQKKKIGWVGDVNSFTYKSNKIKKIGWQPQIKDSDQAIIKTLNDLYFIK